MIRRLFQDHDTWAVTSIDPHLLNPFSSTQLYVFFSSVPLLLYSPPLLCPSSSSFSIPLALPPCFCHLPVAIAMARAQALPMSIFRHPFHLTVHITTGYLTLPLNTTSFWSQMIRTLTLPFMCSFAGTETACCLWVNSALWCRTLIYQVSGRRCDKTVGQDGVEGLYRRIVIYWHCQTQLVDWIGVFRLRFESRKRSDGPRREELWMPYYLCACSFDPLLVSNAPLSWQCPSILNTGNTQPSASHDTQPLHYPPLPSLPSSLSSLSTILSIPLASSPPLPSSSSYAGPSSASNMSLSHPPLSDDEEDAVFTKHRSGSDSDLFKKVLQVYLTAVISAVASLNAPGWFKKKIYRHLPFFLHIHNPWYLCTILLLLLIFVPLISLNTATHHTYVIHPNPFRMSLSLFSVRWMMY